MEASSKITLRVGETHRMILAGLGASGYAWDFTVKGSDVLSVSEEPVAPSAASPSSYNCDVVYTITALRPGNAQVRFVLRRPWEHDRPPLREVVVGVNVV